MSIENVAYMLVGAQIASAVGLFTTKNVKWLITVVVLWAVVLGLSLI